MTDIQYNALLVMYHEMNDDFWLISIETKDLFFARLLGE